MPSPTDTNYTARFELPHLIERATDNVLKCPVYLNGALAAPSSGTVTIYDESGDAVVDTAAVTVTGDVAQYSYTPAASLSLSTRWRVEWTLVAADTVTHVFRNDAALVRRRLYNPVTDVDLFRVAPELDPAGTAPLTRESNFQDYHDEAWVQTQQWLLRQDNRPNLVVSPSALRDVVLYTTLAIIFESIATRLNEGYEMRAQQLWRRVETLRRDTRLEYDTDDDGIADAGEKRGAQAGGFWLGNGARYTGRRYPR